MKARLTCIFILSLFLLPVLSCKPQIKKTQDRIAEKKMEKYKIPEQYNFRFVAVTEGITRPENDRRTYYRVLIDKAEEGRTTIGLESQEKFLELKLAPNRHLIEVDQWVLNEKLGEYEKMKKINQPKPAYIYFTTRPDRILVLKLILKAGQRAEFSSSFELETGD